MFKLFQKNKGKKYEISLPEAEDDFSYDWSPSELPEGQLLVDVYESNDSIVVKSTISGVSPENLSVSLHKDILTIKGKRESDDLIKNFDSLIQECYWGSFSRSIVLPEEVNNKKINAVLENGVLTIILEKIYKGSDIKIKIKS